MPTYNYSVTRSQRPEHQLPGLQCGAAFIEGQSDFASSEEAFDFARSCCFVPGTWTLNVWRRHFREPRRVVEVVRGVV